MNGISPRPVLLTPPQAQISSTIAQTVPELPLVVADMIAQYAYVNIAHSQRPLVFDTENQLVESDENRDTMEAIKTVLVSPEIEPDFRQAIFRNLNEALYNGTFAHYCKSLNSIFDLIRNDGNQIILDHLDFSGHVLAGLNLSSASIISAKFDETTLISVKLQEADLTESSFRKARFVKSNLSEAIMIKSVFDETEFDRVDMSGANLTRAGYYNASFKLVIATGVVSDDVYLVWAMRFSVVRQEQITSYTPLCEVMQDYLEMHPDTASKEIVVLNGHFTSNERSTMYILFPRL